MNLRRRTCVQCERRFVVHVRPRLWFAGQGRLCSWTCITDFGWGMLTDSLDPDLTDQYDS